MWLTIFGCYNTTNVLAEDFEGPVSADVIKIIDGDTIVVKAKIWLNQDLETAVRLRGVDAPEIKGKCPEEIYLAQQAKHFIENKISKNVFLYNISLDKYGGRVVANVVYYDSVAKINKDLGSELLQNNLGIVYNGGHKKSWCKLASYK